MNKFVKGWSLEFFNHGLHVWVRDVMNWGGGIWLEKVDWSGIVGVSMWVVNWSESHRVVVVRAQIMFHLCCVVMAVRWDVGVSVLWVVAVIN